MWYYPHYYLGIKAKFKTMLVLNFFWPASKVTDAFLAKAGVEESPR
jgi:hypothetical protein